MQCLVAAAAGIISRARSGHHQPRPQQHSSGQRHHTHLVALVVERHAKEAGAAPGLLRVDQPLVNPAGAQPGRGEGVCACRGRVLPVRGGSNLLAQRQGGGWQGRRSLQCLISLLRGLRWASELTPWRRPSAWRTAPCTVPQKSADPNGIVWHCWLTSASDTRAAGLSTSITGHLGRPIPCAPVAAHRRPAAPPCPEGKWAAAHGCRPSCALRTP